MSDPTIGTDPSHVQIIEWVVGTVVVVGGGMLGIMKLMLKGKRNSVECDLIHTSLGGALTDIKNRLEKGDSKMDGMKETLIEISTTLKVRSKDETERYDRHSKEWKDQ